MRPLLWVSKSRAKVADALQKQGHEDQRQQREETVADARLQPAVEPQG